MATHSQSRSYSRKSAWTFVLVGVLAGVTVGGGVGVIAASSTKSVTVCADTKTNVLRYAKNGKCVKTETKVVLNQTGADGISGAVGAKGETGAKGDSGAAGVAGAKGDTGAAGAAGAKGDAGTAGAKGDAGTAGAKGDSGTNGTNATLAITQQSVCDGSDAGVVADELCKIGMTGPGGGLIFFVDFNDQYTGFDYLEAAPSSCEGTGKAWSSDTTNSLVAVNGWAARAVGAGKANSAAMIASGATLYEGDTSGAASFAEGSTCGTQTDWFLGSLGEMKLMYDNLQGVGGFAAGNYWSSSESSARYAWSQLFNNGYQGSYNKVNSFYVRPVRAF